MAQFIAVGTITTDIVRKETLSGVLATFRLSAGQRGKGQVWIDVEAWGHLAGTLHMHGARDRHVVVAGRITLKTWHDRATGVANTRYVITATDIDLLPADPGDPASGVDCTNAVVLAGTVENEPATRSVRNGNVTEFRLISGKAGSKTGRLWIDIEHWHPEQASVAPMKRDFAALRGRLAFRTQNGQERGHYYIAANELQIVPKRSAVPAG